MGVSALASQICTTLQAEIDGVAESAFARGRCALENRKRQIRGALTRKEEKRIAYVFAAARHIWQNAGKT